MAFQLLKVYLISNCWGEGAHCSSLETVNSCDEKGAFLVENCILFSLPSTFLDFTAQKSSTCRTGRQLINKEKLIYFCV